MEPHSSLSGKRNSRKIKILGIAPYEGMKTIMRKLADARSDVELDVFVGDLNKGVAIARQNFNSNYDVIISRGGTAELIGHATHIPVVEVTLSVYDILRAIKLAENYADRYAIVGFPAITACAHLLCDLLQYKIDIFTIHSKDDVQETLKDLKKKGYRMVLCDMIANTTAKRLGLNAILITSGSESISSALDQAVRLSTGYASVQTENLFLREVIRNGNSQTIIMKENGEIFFSTADEEQMVSLNSMLVRELPAVLSGGTQKFFKNIDGRLYSFTCRRLDFSGEACAVFYFSATQMPFATSKYGIQYSNQQEAEDHFFNSFFSITNSANNMQATIENINQTAFPILLSGETGSGKEQAARIIYSRSALRANPLITINCPLITERSWNFITNHYNSPFNDSGNTIYFKDITALEENRLHLLLSIIVDVNLCRRNRVIFSCTCPRDQGLPASAMSFINTLSCVNLHLLPLRELANEISTLSSLYLNTINVSMANQIIGFEPEAMELLQAYDWPCNYTQFKRILNELALMTTTPYIQADHVRALLEKERETISCPLSSTTITAGSGESQADPGFRLNLELSLDEMNRQIIHQVLRQTDGNQSAAAKRLGISRTTLWRYLKD